MTNSVEKPKLDLQPPRGTRDFFPLDHRLKSWLHSTWRKSALLYGFEEYDSSVVEHEDLYVRKSGEEISEQLYNFRDKSDRRLCLRPEMTPSLARMVLSKGSLLPLPLKWFSVPQCWRYERMTRGRRREHYQWNMDIWGVAGVEAEAELLGAMVHAMRAMGLTAQDVGIKVNTRKLISDLLHRCDIDERIHKSACVVIDKIDKLPADKLIEELGQLGIASDKAINLLSLIEISSLEDMRAAVGEGSEGLRDLEELLVLANAHGYADWMVFSPSVVRGLSYYTGIVFECFDREGLLRAICGGGRYDSLLDTFSDTSKPTDSASKKSIPAVGFGFGDAVIVELLKDKGLLPDFSSDMLAQVVVGATDKSLYLKAAATASLLRREGVSVDLVMQEKRLKGILQRADKLKSCVAVVFAPQEYQSGKVIVKNMKIKNSQVEVTETCILAAVNDVLGG